jgi:hypothetical protein
MTTTTQATDKGFHYFGSTAFNWATGTTRAEVLEKLAKSCGSTILKKAIKQGGLYAWTIRVMVPQESHYDICYFQPVGVECEASQEYNIMSATGAALPIERADK